MKRKILLVLLTSLLALLLAGCPASPPPTTKLEAQQRLEDETRRKHEEEQAKRLYTGQVLGLDPAHPEARQILSEVVTRYATLGETAVAGNQLDQARRYQQAAEELVRRYGLADAEIRRLAEHITAYDERLAEEKLEQQQRLEQEVRRKQAEEEAKRLADQQRKAAEQRQEQIQAAKPRKERKQKFRAEQERLKQELSRPAPSPKPRQGTFIPPSFGGECEITTASPLPSERVNRLYSKVILRTIDCTPPLTWLVSAGKLPPGLSLSPMGKISGTPTEEGKFTFEVIVRNIKNIFDTVTLQITIIATPSAFQRVDRSLETMEWGNIAFNTPTSMNLEDKARIQLLLGLELAHSIEELSLGLKAELENEGINEGIVPHVESARVKVSERVEARLSGSDFEIKPITPEVQPVGSASVTGWKWDVKPKSSGRHYLDLILNALISIDGQSTPKTIRTFHRKIAVEVRWSQRISGFISESSGFISEHLEWFWATIIAGIAGWLFKKDSKNPKG